MPSPAGVALAEQRADPVFPHGVQPQYLELLGTSRSCLSENDLNQGLLATGGACGPLALLHVSTYSEQLVFC